MRAKDIVPGVAYRYRKHQPGAHPFRGRKQGGKSYGGSPGSKSATYMQTATAKGMRDDGTVLMEETYPVLEYASRPHDVVELAERLRREHIKMLHPSKRQRKLRPSTRTRLITVKTRDVIKQADVG